MMWYGFKKTSSLKRRIKNQSNRLNLKDRQIGRPLPRRSSYPDSIVTFQLPLNCDFLLLESSNPPNSNRIIYLYNSVYFFNFVFSPFVLRLTYSSQSSSFRLTHSALSYCYRSSLKFITTLFNRFSLPFFLKVRFKGKGYYVYKNYRNTIAPQFGYAHRVYIYAQATSVRFLSKTKVLLFGLCARDVYAVGYSLKKVKPINIFTGRGVRFARQVIYKKTGKVSSYR